METISTNSKAKDSETGFEMHPGALVSGSVQIETSKGPLLENLVSLAGSKIIHTNTRIVFAQAGSVAKIGFPSYTVTKQALPSSLANTGVLIQRAKSREVLLHKGEAEDTFQSHYPLA